MKKGFLQDLQKKAYKYTTGRDYLRLIIKEEERENIEKLEAILERLDNDNSNMNIEYFKDCICSMYKVSTKSGEALIVTTVYNDISIPIFFFEKYDNHTAKFTGSWGRMDFYGMYDRMIEIGHIKKVHKKEYLFGFIDHISRGKKISRYDWKIDLFFTTNKKLFRPEDITKLRKNSKVDYKVIGKSEIQSWRLGARKTKQYLIRGYDKQADTLSKGKFPMYKDYFAVYEEGEKIEFKNVHRLEFEFLNNFCRKFTFDTILQLEDHIEKFLNLDKSIGSIFVSKNNIDIGEIQDKFKYARSTKGYMEGCIKNGINIFGLLEEVFESMGKSEEEIQDLFFDFLKRKKIYETMYASEEDLMKLYFSKK